MRRCCVRVVFRFFLLAFVLATLSIASIAQLGGGGVNVLTWHNDNYRTGDNLSESVLTADAVSQSEILPASYAYPEIVIDVDTSASIALLSESKPAPGSRFFCHLQEASNSTWSY